MNIIQLHDKVLSFVDQARSGRIDPKMIDACMNVSIDTSIKQRIGMENVVGQNGFYPMENTRMKDSLGYYYQIEELDTTTTSNNIPGLLIANSKPALLLLDSIEINIGTKTASIWITPVPVNKKDRQEYQDNVFLKPSNESWKVMYYSYDGRIMSFMLPQGVSLSQIRIGYYRKTPMLSCGTMVNFTDFIGTSVSVIFYSNVSTYNGTTKFRGEEMTIGKSLFTAGTIVQGFSPIDIDPDILEQACASAAKILMGMKEGIFNEEKER
jgi:hypothetical protein